MARKQTVASLLTKYASEEVELAARVEALQEEIASIAGRLEEVRVIREALSDAQGDAAPQKAPPKKTPAKPVAKKAAKKTAAKKPAAAAPSADDKPAEKVAAKPATKKPATKRRAKGRRKANAKGVHALGIVDAAVYLAKQKDTAVATAGEVLDWFLEAGYKTRSGSPNRNSVYVSLNREATETHADGKVLVSRPERGKFMFHF